MNQTSRASLRESEQGATSGEDGRVDTALVRRPGPRLADGLVTHIERRDVDVDLAVGQWTTYVEAFRGAGWEPIEVPAADDCPDAVFVEDTVVVYDELAVITNPGAAVRRPETALVASTLAALGHTIARIEPPGTIDGGDVLKVGGGTVYVGLGGRTNLDGLNQLRALLEPRGATVVDVATTKVLHLKSAVTALPDGSIVGFAPLVDDPTVFPHFRPVPEESGSHVVLLGDDRLLMAADAPASAELFADLGYAPITVDISEFQKLEGCVTCLSVRLRGLADLDC
jgi:dimethylargininase